MSAGGSSNMGCSKRGGVCGCGGGHCGNDAELNKCKCEGCTCRATVLSEKVIPSMFPILPDEFWERVSDCGGTKNLGRNAVLLQTWVKNFARTAVLAEREAIAKQIEADLGIAALGEAIQIAIAATIRARN